MGDGILSSIEDTPTGKETNMHIKPHLMTVLKARIVTILYLLEKLYETYGKQESQAKLLEAVKRAMRCLEPVIRMVQQNVPGDVRGCAEEVLGTFATDVAECYANAGWFVAEIDALLGDTSCELNPEIDDDPPFIIPESMPEEQLKTIRDSFDSASKAFDGINVRFDDDGNIKTPFGL